MIIRNKLSGNLGLSIDIEINIMPKSKKESSSAKGKSRSKTRCKRESSPERNQTSGRRSIDNVSTFNNHSEADPERPSRRFHKRIHREPSEDISEQSNKGSRKDEKKKLIYLSKQVYNIVREQKTINGNDVMIFYIMNPPKANL